MYVILVLIVFMPKSFPGACFPRAASLGTESISFKGDRTCVSLSVRLVTPERTPVGLWREVSYL